MSDDANAFIERCLRDAIEHATAAHRYVSGLSQSGFAADLRAQDAVIRRLTVVGEAVARLLRADAAMPERHPAIPWRAVRAMRNRLVHEYDEIDLDIVWRAAREEAPPLCDALRALLEEDARGPA
jgi:uncharacterized protein with HEPN domain